jgi:hypothetical protein
MYYAPDSKAQIPGKQHFNDISMNLQISGYAGYIQAMKPENMFGKTYGTITYLSSAGMYNKGADVPSDLRYRSTQSDAFIDQLGLRGSQMEIAKEMSNGGGDLKFGDILKTQTVSILELTTKGGHSPRSVGPFAFLLCLN